MRVAADNFVNGTRAVGALEQVQCLEITAADGSAWAHVVVDGAPPDRARLIASEGQEPITVAVNVNPAGVRWTVPLAEGAQISARPGYPRLELP